MYRQKNTVYLEQAYAKYGVPDKEIAERLGLTVNNVKCRRFDRNKLLKKIQEQQ